MFVLSNNLRDSHNVNDDSFMCLEGSHRLEKYLNLQDCLEKYLKNTKRP